jgi:hypothetical protein
MHVSVIAALLTGLCIAADAAQTRMIPITERNGAAYVSTTDLERSASIAVKMLPGSDAVAVCHEDRCAPMKGLLREADRTLVNVTELAKALGFAARFSDDRQKVQFEPESKPLSGKGSITRIGNLAPNFRVARLDGSPVSLADFRGKRVLIQSWASW